MDLTGMEGAAAAVGRQVLVNFCSASFLGLQVDGWLRHHAAASLVGWGLASGLPRSLATDEPTRALEVGLARLVDAEAALAGPSTLHLLLDTVAALAGPRGIVALPRRAYTLARAAAERACGLGCTVVVFDPDRTAPLWARLRRARGPKVIIAESFAYPGVPFPLAPLLDRAVIEGAFVVVDDTLAMGVLGAPSAGKPYGIGGGGGLLFQGMRPDQGLVQVASLAKGFSIPLAFVAADRQTIRRVTERASLLAASSPADLATVHAALWALNENRARGEALRQALVETVTLLNVAGGLTAGAQAFPVLSLYFRREDEAARAASLLLAMGIWALPQRAPNERARCAAAVRFNVSAAHAGPPAARALDVLQRVVGRGRAHHERTRR